jgi:hypothetical protein
MFSNQNLAINGSPITNMSVGVFDKSNMIAAQQGAFDSSNLLETFLKLDPNRNMMLLQTEWDKKVMKKASFASSVYRRVVTNNAVLTVNGQDGGFKWKMAVETNNCFRTVEDTSDQSPDGYVGVDGSSFKMGMNKKLAPGQVITIDPLSDLYLIVDDIEVEYTGYGYIHYMKLLGSEQDINKVYPTEYLKSDVTYSVMSGSFIAELTEKLGIAHLPESSSYIEGEFKLGSGQGHETWFTGKADSYKMSNNGYTTADTQSWLEDFQKYGLEDNPLVAVTASGASGSITTIADLTEIMTIRAFNERFNKSLMFMQAAKQSTSKGSLELNEGLWQQMQRGKKFTYAGKGMFNEADLQQVKNYVFKYNTSDVETTFLRIEAGTMLTENIERLIAKHAQAQLQFLAPILGSDRPFSAHPVSGALNALVVAPVKFSKALVPGVGMLEVTKDTSLDYVTNADIRTRGVNPRGYDHTTYSGYIWDVEDQSFSNNGTFPEGTKQIGGETTAKSNVYFIRPERGAIVWGRENGRYSSSKVSDIASSNKLMGESFWIYGFGALWMPDPSKFVQISLKYKIGGLR